MTKEEGFAKIADWGEKLRELQDLLFYASENSCLVILQGMDASGKDGTIRRPARCVNIQSCRVASFKQPTPWELSHDFLWRVHAHTTAKGQMAVFNRSHYEDVVVVRVHGIVPKDIWKSRYEQINNFEKLLAKNGTIILKFFLYIAKKEQEERLLVRERDIEKARKLSVGDWKERELRSDYMVAHEDALEKCSTDWAPWHIIPAEHQWFRDLVVIERILLSLEPFKEGWLAKLDRIGRSALEEIKAYRSQKQLS